MPALRSSVPDFEDVPRLQPRPRLESRTSAREPSHPVTLRLTGRPAGTVTGASPAPTELDRPMAAGAGVVACPTATRDAWAPGAAASAPLSAGGTPRMKVTVWLAAFRADPPAPAEAMLPADAATFRSVNWP